jgi:hypothetical protein
MATVIIPHRREERTPMRTMTENTTAPYTMVGIPQAISREVRRSSLHRDFLGRLVEVQGDWHTHEKGEDQGTGGKVQRPEEGIQDAAPRAPQRSTS